MTTVPPPFIGSIPDAYDEFLVPVVFAPWAALATEQVAALAPASVLEVACGTGAGIRALHAALPTARLVATDLSADMLARAQAHLPAATVEWQPADVQHLPFDDGTFDVALCLFGIMFVPDRIAAYRELRRVLAPGGTLLLATWDTQAANPYTAALDAGVIELIPSDPPIITCRVAHGYHDPELITADLSAAGFADIEVDRQTRTSTATAAGLARGFGTGSPLAALSVQRGVSRAEMTAALERAFEAQFGPEPFELTMSALVVLAR